MDANAWQLDWKSSLSAPRFQDSQNAGVTYKSKENLLQEIVTVPLKDMIWVWVQACRCSTHRFQPPPARRLALQSGRAGHGFSFV